MNETQLIYEQMKCKIQTLEKENAELKTKKIPELERKIASIRGCHKIDLIKLRARAEQVERLKKENAELKGEADSVMDNWCKGNDPCPHLKKRDEQLTKAKDLLLKLSTCLEGHSNNNFEYALIKEAEQFLNEVEK